MQQLSDDLSVAQKTLENLGRLSEIDNQQTISELFQWCPECAQYKWHGKEALTVFTQSHGKQCQVTMSPPRGNPWLLVQLTLQLRSGTVACASCNNVAMIFCNQPHKSI